MAKKKAQAESRRTIVDCPNCDSKVEAEQKGQEVTAWNLTALFGVFLACVAPGSLIIFLFDSDLALELETFKVVLLSSALTLPIVALNAFMLVGLGPFVKPFRKTERGHDRKHSAFWLMAWTFLVLYLSILVRAFWWELTPGSFFVFVLVIDLTFAVPMVMLMKFLATEDV